MTILLKQIFALFKLLNSETGNYQIASGVALGFVLGMSPFFSLQTFVILLLLLVFRIQIGAAFTSAFFFKFIAYLIDPLADRVGRSILETESLQPLFAELYNMPIVPYTKFYNSIVMGSGAIGFLLSPVIFFLALWAIKKYRTAIVARFKETKTWKALQATGFYKWYVSYDQFYG